MSKNSTARTGSGDADTKDCKKELYPNVFSAPASFQSKRDLGGGPYGDSPPDQQKHSRRDYFILMLQDNERSSETSDCEDQELYDLKHDYLQKLNLVRKRLDLIEIAEDDSIQSSSGGCKITEIIDEEDQCEKEDIIHDTSTDSANKSERSENFVSCDVKTLHPFSLCYTAESKSATDIFEMEYNPPKKKSCYRLQTPKLPSTSESNIPYHTKVTLHEDLFKNKDNTEKIETDLNIQTWNNAISKFTATKETQCSEENLVISKRSTNEAFSGIHKNLFPQVIIKQTTKEEASSESSTKLKETKCMLQHIPHSNLKNLTYREDEYKLSERNAQSDTKSPSVKSLDQTSKTSSTNLQIRRTPNVPNFLVNSFAEPSEESYNTVSSSLTTIEENDKEIPKKKRRLWRKNTQRQTMWDDLQQRDGTHNQKIIKKRSQFLTQFTGYKKEKIRSHSCPTSNRDPVLFGPGNLNNFGNAPVDSKFFYFSSDTEWHSSRFETPISEKENRNKFWRGLFSCCGLFKREQK